MCIIVLATDLNNACSGNPECALGNGGANSICSTNCICNTGYVENGGTCAKGTLSIFHIKFMSRNISFFYILTCLFCSFVLQLVFCIFFFFFFFCNPV